MNMDILQETLVLESDGLQVRSRNSKTRVLSEIEDLIDYTFKNPQDVDSFDIHIHGRHLHRLLQSYMLVLTHVNIVSLYFDTIDNSHQAKEQYSKSSKKLEFCLISDLAGRLSNYYMTDILVSSNSPNEQALKPIVAENTRRVEEKLRNLPTERFPIRSIPLVGLNARNINTIGKQFLCGSCSYILRDPAQLICGHLQCKSCAENCKGNTITCSECQEKTSKDETFSDRGFCNDMKKLDIVCSHCDWNGKLEDYEEHLDRSHQNSICEYCSEKFASTNDLNVHQQNECRWITMPCALAEHDCSHSVLRTEISNHYLSEQHQLALINCVRRLKSKSATKKVNEVTNAHSQDVNQSIELLSGGLQTLTNDMHRLSNESLSMQSSIESSKQEFSSLKLKIQEQNALLHELIPKQDILKQVIASLKQRLEEIPYLSYDGTYLWKITNVQEKIADAQSERQTSIYSPPFYSSPTGYKMRARLYLNGDGNARRTHMSLFFVLMRGEYDAILKFPFNYKITFCLFDQTSQQRHIIDSFRPDIKSNSFQRPRSDMNIASGIPKFFLSSMIQQEGNPYVRDGTMFIKVMIDFRGIPTVLLPDVLSINPGLPQHVQYDTIPKMLDTYRCNRSVAITKTIHDDSQISRNILHSSSTQSQQAIATQSLQVSTVRSRGTSPSDGRSEDSYTEY